MQSIVVKWGKCTEYMDWCSFDSLELCDAPFDGLVGVYVIWKDRHVIYVGSGQIGKRLSHHHQQAAITRYFPELKFTWAPILNDTHRLGVEHYLIETLYPKVQGAVPEVDQIRVNYPWK